MDFVTGGAPWVMLKSWSDWYSVYLQISWQSQIYGYDSTQWPFSRLFDKHLGDVSRICQLNIQRRHKCQVLSNLLKENIIQLADTDNITHMSCHTALRWDLSYLFTSLLGHFVAVRDIFPTLSVYYRFHKVHQYKMICDD